MEITITVPVDLCISILEFKSGRQSAEQKIMEFMYFYIRKKIQKKGIEK